MYMVCLSSFTCTTALEMLLRLRRYSVKRVGSGGGSCGALYFLWGGEDRLLGFLAISNSCYFYCFFLIRDETF